MLSSKILKDKLFEPIQYVAHCSFRVSQFFAKFTKLKKGPMKTRPVGYGPAIRNRLC